MNLWGLGTGILVTFVGALGVQEHSDRCALPHERQAFSTAPLFDTIVAPDSTPAAGSEATEVSTMGPGIQMPPVQTIWMPAYTIVSGPGEVDADHDGRGEFILRAMPTWSGRIEFYEAVADNTYTLAHMLDLSTGTTSSFQPDDVGDADGDGLAEVTVYGRTLNDFFLRLYESASPSGFPTGLVWQQSDVWFEVGAKIADTDGDGLKEIVAAGDYFRIAVYENQGDDAYVQTYYEQFLDLHTSQAMEVADDLDQDGRAEILYGGLTTTAVIHAVESTGDNAYQRIWQREMVHADGQIVNVQEIVYAGDLDGDGKREFLAGGRKTVSGGGPAVSILYDFEATGDNTFEVVATFSQPIDSGARTAANVADVDGDGRREIVFGSGVVKIYRCIGDNTWQEVWSGTSLELRSIGAGDHDADGKTELIWDDGEVDIGGSVAYFTTIREIDPADAADLDGDGLVDVIDNCPTTVNPAQDDGDGDTVGDACDNCVDGPNPDQGPAVFAQELQAMNSITFGWTVPAAVVHVRGDLALVSTYATDLVDRLPSGTSLEDPTMPPVESGFYYLVRPDCMVGSWQSSPGAEPARDTVLP